MLNKFIDMMTLETVNLEFEELGKLNKREFKQRKILEHSYQLFGDD